MREINNADYLHGGTAKDRYLPEEVENWNCPFCGNNRLSVICKERGLAVVKCAECSLLYTNPKPIHSERNYFENSDIFFREAFLIFKGKKPHHRDKNYEHELKQIGKFKKAGKLLDVGTYMGFFLRKARAFGWQTEGVEPSPAVSKIAREQFGLNVHTAFLQEIELPAKNYDVITLIDVFEHVTNPKEILRKCHELLRDDGILVIKVPNGRYNRMKQRISEAFKSKSSDIWNCREHVVHYDAETFSAMVESCNFKIVSFTIPIPIHPPVWQHLVGHYFQYPSPIVLDWKRVFLRNTFYTIGKIERIFKRNVHFAPDLMFILRKR